MFSHYMCFANYSPRRPFLPPMPPPHAQTNKGAPATSFIRGRAAVASRLLARPASYPSDGGGRRAGRFVPGLQANQRPYHRPTTVAFCTLATRAPPKRTPATSFFRGRAALLGRPLAPPASCPSGGGR